MPALPFRQALAAGLLVAAPLVLFVALPGALPAQTILTVSPQQCVWHAGDDPAWAASNLDESGWRPLAQFNLPSQPDGPHFWVRCHADLSSLNTLAHPALQILFNAAYQVYLDGSLVGANGNPATGFHYQNSYETFPIEGDRISAGPRSTIGIRFFIRLTFQQSPNPALQILAGDEQSLLERRASLVLAGAANWLPTAIGFGIIGVAGFVFLGLYAYDHGRPEVLILAIVCWSLSCIRVLQSLYGSHIRIWDYEYTVFTLVAFAGTNLMPFFAYRLNRRKVPLAYKLVSGINIALWFYLLCVMFLPLDAAYRFDQVVVSAGVYTVVAAAVFSSSLVAAFLPWRVVAPPMRPLAICCFVWASADLLYILPILTANFAPGAAVLYFRLQPSLLVIRGFGVITVIIALAALLLRDQQRTARERAELAGEMQAARTVQQVIIPETLPSVPGFAIESVYKPAGEVGGDFFQIIATRNGGVLIVIGDVSGKGMPAAMTVSLLVGTIRTLAHYTQSPREILAAMNTRMLGRQQGGFTTCLVLRADPDGALTLANAGHLAPYVSGAELKIENGLPLGLEPQAAYPESAHKLPPGACLTLISDGVAEARNKSGELFGFERTRAISTESAQSIARAAQAHGQEDDITVLILTFAPTLEPLSGRSALPVPAPA
jgi:hypothetical protein